MEPGGGKRCEHHREATPPEDKAELDKKVTTDGGIVVCLALWLVRWAANEINCTRLNLGRFDGEAQSQASLDNSSTNAAMEVPPPQTSNFIRLEVKRFPHSVHRNNANDVGDSPVAFRDRFNRHRRHSAREFRGQKLRGPNVYHKRWTNQPQIHLFTPHVKLYTSS